MSKFGFLTRFIPEIEEDEIGRWNIDAKNDGSPEHPIRMSVVSYSQMVDRFVANVYALVDEYPEWTLTSYGKILEQNGITSMRDAIVDDLDAQCIGALLVGAVRAERFCDGALMSFFKNGSITRWLKRLKELDEEEKS